MVLRAFAIIGLVQAQDQEDTPSWNYDVRLWNGTYELFISNLDTSESISHDNASNKSSLFGVCSPPKG
ncbi:hypothetical protein IGI04_012892 [Brassica rapa subsp. trilocularis]|uniref:Uncharacterized protein n=3 Tax=Brassica TaxID=3705 RepID=A0A8D9GNX2_BRACM|nr:hypothetical protein IGI04_012892 [Brassica rapa subsp. trilocularis]CAF2130394.1 unnamed protein product [Brassica napus]CAG7883899.1 unnamed protein product [Brassica rapa]